MKRAQHWLNHKRVTKLEHLGLWIAGIAITTLGYWLMSRGHMVGASVHDIGLAPIVTSLWKSLGAEV